jgi:predicted short-subunit dehydrogenase-like oxidoreductase (DUF2520 family)
MPVSDDPIEGASLPWVIVGYGRVGQAIALLAEELGHQVSATWNRTRQAYEAATVSSPAPLWGELGETLSETLSTPSLVWLTVVDDAIEATFDTLSDSIAGGSLVVHTSGSRSSQLLSARPDLHVASLHPMQAIADPRAALRRFSRSFWSVEGDDRAVEILGDLLAPAQIKPLRLQAEDKILYHASAVTAANLLVSLIDGAMAIAGAADIGADQARQMLLELAGSSLENLAAKPPRQALTGPAARRDLATIEAHRRALAELDDKSLLDIYDLLTERALQGLSD